MGIEQANLLLLRFGEDFGLTGLALDEHAYACLQFADLTVNLEYAADQDALFLSTRLILPPNGREKIYADLLEANLAAALRGGASFGYERAQDVLVLADRLPLLGAGHGEFEDRLTLILQTARTWKNAIGSAAVDPRRSDIETDPSVFLIRA